AQPVLPAKLLGSHPNTPSAPAVFQDSTPEELLFPPPYHNPCSNPPQLLRSADHPPPEAGGARGQGPAAGTRSVKANSPDSTVLPLRVAGLPNEQGNQPMHYWPFATSDLYNWRAQNARFSDNPKDLVNLLDTVLFTHQPTWDDCQQLLQVLFTTEERDRILTAARKLVPGEDGTPTTNAARIDLVFPLTRPDWDFNQAEGKERLRVYRQTLMAGLRAAARKPTNLAKVGDVQQGREETPAAFLERLMEAFRQYTPMDPEATENRAAVVAEKVYNRRETPEQREDRIRQEERKDRQGSTLPEPRLTLKVEGRPVNFLVDTGAQHSVLTEPLGKLSGKTSWVQGATGCKQYPWTTKRSVDLGKGQVSHTFVVIPECPYPLIGRDLLTKVGAQISFGQEGVEIKDFKGSPLHVLTISLQDEYRLLVAPDHPPLSGWWMESFSNVWAETGGVGLASHRPPIIVQLKPGAEPIRVKQYPMPAEAKAGITPHIRRLLDSGILKTCHSSWNTPLLPVRKPHSQDFRPVQDLREVNKRVIDIHPTVPNPYTLLSALPPTHVWYTVLDLKDAFFSLPLAPQSQEMFAFEWQDAERGISGQLTWTRLPQGFKNSPTLFDEALHEDLRKFRSRFPELTLLQYVDDLLLAAESKHACRTGTAELLTELGQMGYRVSAKKAQICLPEVIYLGYRLKNGYRWLTEARKATVLQLPTPTTKREVREFLGSAGFCRLWIPGFADLAQPLYEATREKVTFQWTPQMQQSFESLKRALLSAPALGLPDITKPFHLFVDEAKGIAKGVLTQSLGPWRRPVAYLSKKLDPVASGWPPCLRMVAAAALLFKDSQKLSLGQVTSITTPHAVEGVLRQPPERWMSNARITHYQSLLLNPERVNFSPPTGLNPASLLPAPDLEAHLDCVDILAQVQGLRPDLRDNPLPDGLVWFTDGSSFIHEGRRAAGAAVVSMQEVIWAEPLPSGTSAQKAELIALTKALTLARGKNLTVYTDSRYAFATAHVHGAIYRERGLLTSDGKGIKNAQEIMDLLAALWLPRKLAIVHHPGHQKDSSTPTQGNKRADEAARQAALMPVDALTVKLPDPGDPQLPEDPEYSAMDFDYIQSLPGAFSLGHWWYTQETKAILPAHLATDLIQRLHRATHLGERKILTLIRQWNLHVRDATCTVRQVVASCQSCAMVNATKTTGEPGMRPRGTRPGVHWEIDFTEVRPGKFGYRYLLVLVDTFSGWPEAFPTRGESARVVAKILLENIFPRFGFPVTIGSDNGPAFVSQVSKSVASALGAEWKLHCAYRPQSSGQVERMNRTLKETLTKLTLESGGDWVTLLPYALFRARNSPYRLGLSPFEIIYGTAPPTTPHGAQLACDLPSDCELFLSVWAVQQAHQEVWPRLRALYEGKGPSQTAHKFQPENLVLVRRHKTDGRGLQPRWKGPYIVLLTTPTALKVDGIAAWVHHSHVKTAPTDDSQLQWRAQKHPTNPLKLTLQALPATTHRSQTTAHAVKNDTKL
ncbi:uncharacterized protein LOC119258442, partial [Talpa occidentalis]|uniref:uncharacterized protein LOC119258442 n=1 Tax=Talpa occidentalis TaxID=50954 RepID=UPI0018907235